MLWGGCSVNEDTQGTKDNLLASNRACNVAGGISNEDTQSTKDNSLMSNLYVFALKL